MICVYGIWIFLFLFFFFWGLIADALIDTGLAKLGYEYVNIGMLKSNNSLNISFTH